jgi:predicted Ser/Thr protein kinase
LGPYEILDLIGAGGMGEVWKARDTRLGRTVAIKVSKQQFSERFEQEARAVGALNHPHICQLYDVGPDYLVMEFVEGTPLKGPLPVAKAVEYAGQILGALNAAHRNGITHRDLKPANILVTKQGIKLLDFGLAKRTGVLQDDSTVTEALTHQGQILGTLQYMSPEQLQGEDADARSDLFSFGCVLYEIISGERPFAGNSGASVIAAIMEHDPKPLSVNPQLDRVIGTCLAKDPDQRFQNAVDLKRALTWALEERPVSKSMRFAWWAAALVIFAAGLAVFTVTNWHSPPAEDVAVRLELNPPEGGRFVFGQNSGGIALSPDGKTLAFVAQVSTGTHLWVRPLDGGSARPLPGTDDAQYPFWSPDSKSIAFFTLDRLMRTDVAGGTPMVICDVNNGRGGAWGSDDRILFAPAERALFSVSALGGGTTPFTSLDSGESETAHYWPNLLPDRHLLFWIRSANLDNIGIHVAPLANPTAGSRILRSETGAIYSPPARPGGAAHLLWLRGSTLVAQELDVTSHRLKGDPRALANGVGRIGNLGRINVSASGTGVLAYGASSGTGQLQWFDRKGNRVASLWDPAEIYSFRLSPDDRRVAVSTLSSSGKGDVWLIEGGRGIATRFTSLPGFNTDAVWSPDARTIIFGSGAPRNIYRKDVSGDTAPHRITTSGNPQWVADWTSDGRFLMYVELAPETGRDIWILALTPDGRVQEGTSPTPYARTPFAEHSPRFCPERNPRWIAYESNETGRSEVYLERFPVPGAKRRISTAGGRFPQWGGDIRELFYLAPTNKLMAVTLNFRGDSVEPSTPREMFALPPADTILSPYEVSQDNQRFLVHAGLSQGAPPLTVIVNWPALLKKEPSQ